MKPRHLEKSDPSYKIFLYIFYVCGFVMTSSLIFGVYVTMLEWMENGTYVMGEAIHNTTIPFENFARVSTWIFFSTIIGWYCVSRIGWRRTAGDKIVGTRMALLQLMLLGFSIITLFEVLYNFSVLTAQISAGIINGVQFYKLSVTATIFIGIVLVILSKKIVINNPYLLILKYYKYLLLVVVF